MAEEANFTRAAERVHISQSGVSAQIRQLEVDALPIISERLVAAVPMDHALARRRRVTLADLSAFPIVCLPQGTGIRTVLDQACEIAGLRPDIALQASTPAAVADLAIRGFGVAILSESRAANYNDTLQNSHCRRHRDTRRTGPDLDKNTEPRPTRNSCNTVAKHSPIHRQAKRGLASTPATAASAIGVTTALHRWTMPPVGSVSP